MSRATDLPIDVGRVATAIHDQRKSSRTLAAALHQLRRYLGDDAFDTTVPYTIPDLVLRPAHEMRRLLDMVLQQAEQRIGDPGGVQLQAQMRELLSETDRFLSTTSATGLYRLRNAAIGAQDAVRHIRKLRPPLLSKEPLKTLQDVARDVERLVCVYDLRWAQYMADTTAAELIVLLNYLTGAPVAPDPADTHNAFESITDALADHEYAAHRRGIEFRVRNGTPAAFVTAPRLGLRKAIGNLLDNAIKYTGHLPPGSKHRNTWITVTCKADLRDVHISVESWGLPLTMEEVSAGLPFNYGYRGHYAHRNLPGDGFGVGLTDVKTFVSKYNGDVILVTDPVEKGQRSVFTTTSVTITLPRIITTEDLHGIRSPTRRASAGS
jgi:signal transduction histidine kinase